jgi:hypothetical protein
MGFTATAMFRCYCGSSRHPEAARCTNHGWVSAPRHLQQLLHRNWYVIELGKAATEFVRNIHRHVSRPALSRIEGDDPPRTAILIIQKVADDRLVVGIRFSGL